MLKKVLFGALFLGLVGVLIWGAINRSAAKTSTGIHDGSGQGQGQGQGRGRTQVVNTDGNLPNTQQGQGRNQDSTNGGGQGKGNSQGQNQTGNGSQDSVNGGGNKNGNGNGSGIDSSVARVSEWLAVDGTASSVGDEALVIDLSNGGQLLVEGQPWSYALSQGFMPTPGDHLALTVFEEDAELKPGTIDNSTSGQQVVLRLENGQPMWSASKLGGQGQNQTGSGQGNGGGQGNGSGQGQNQTSSDGQGNGNGQGQNQASSDGQGNGSGQGQNQGGNGGGQGNGSGQGQNQANSETGIAQDWLTIHGVVFSVDADILTVTADDGSQFLIEGRAWQFAQEQGFAIQAGNTCTVTGYYEDGEFKPGTLSDGATGQSISMRDAAGRPLWSGRGGA